MNMLRDIYTSILFLYHKKKEYNPLKESVQGTLFVDRMLNPVANNKIRTYRGERKCGIHFDYTTAIKWSGL